MRPNQLKQLHAQGKTCLMAWQQVPSALQAEILGHSGVDAVCVDLQHTQIDVETASTLIQAVSSTPAVPVVRVSSNSFAEVNKVLDQGAYGVIVPLINSAADAARFVNACQYPPAGQRSWGPLRGLLYGGEDYFEHANQTILKLGMIETREGLSNLDAILAVEGLDGIFVGPGDLSISLTGRPSINFEQGEVAQAFVTLVQRTHAHNKYAGIFCPSVDMGKAMQALGYDMIVIGPDLGMLSAEVKRRVEALRQT